MLDENKLTIFCYLFYLFGKENHIKILQLG
jgi:hypothetical protein